MKKTERDRIASDFVTLGQMTVDVSKLSDKCRDELWSAVIELMIEKGVLIAGEGDDLSVSGETIQQLRMLMESENEGEFNQ